MMGIVVVLYDNGLSYDYKRLLLLLLLLLLGLLGLLELRLGLVLLQLLVGYLISFLLAVRIPRAQLIKRITVKLLIKGIDFEEL
jgi:hypothetical protein